MRSNPSISTWVHWNIQGNCYSGVGQVTGDTYVICPQLIKGWVRKPKATRPLFSLSVRTKNHLEMIDTNIDHEDLMLQADEREHSLVFQENPYTSPWSKYEVKVQPGEVYMHGGKKVVHKWTVTILEINPDGKIIFHNEVASAREYDIAKLKAVDVAASLAARESRNPNDIPVFDKDGFKYHTARSRRVYP